MIKPEAIKSFRRKNGLTQADLAKLAGVSVQKIRLHWETNGIPDKAIKESHVIRKIEKCCSVQAKRK